MSAEATQALRERAAQVRALAEGNPLPSPCVSVCRMDADRRWCQGCLRSIPEITAWRSLVEEDKRAIWHLIEQRLEATA